MGYSAQVAIPLLLFVVLCIPQYAVSQIDPTSMKGVMDAFMGNVAQSGVFTGDQLGDMNTIKDYFVTSVQNMAASGKTSRNMLQAMNMGFASEMAEIVASEQGGGSLSQKTNAISNALGQAFLQVTGVAQNAFVNEIRQLINMFAQASMNDVSTSAAASSSVQASAAAGAEAGAGGPSYQQYQQSISSTSQYGTAYTAQATGSGNFLFIVLKPFPIQCFQLSNT